MLLSLRNVLCNKAVTSCSFFKPAYKPSRSHNQLFIKASPRRLASSGRGSSNFIGRLKSLPPNSYFLLALPCITLYLGIWQIRRRKWKIQLIEEMNSKTRKPAVLAPNDLSEISPNQEYETFVLLGRYDHSRETYIGPRSLIDDSSGGLISSADTIGVHVVTPFVLSSNSEEVLINRGWISMNQKKSNQIFRPEGEQRIVGVLRLSERGASGNMTNSSFDTRLNMWAKRDVQVLADVLGTKTLFFDEVFFKNKELPQGSPIPGQTLVQLRNEHMSYIITWFSLTFLLLLFWAKRYLRAPDYQVIELLKEADRRKPIRPR